MFALHSRRLRRRLSAPTSGSIRRRARERRQAEQTRAEGERIAREKRERRAREKLEQQRKAREELATYQPWGRAGGGAPNPRGVRFTNLRDKGIFPEDELRGVSLHEACRRWATSPLRRQRQTPVKLREDPQLCYADPLRKSVDNDIRYKQSPHEQQSYKQILDEMVTKKKKAMREEKKQNLEYERKMHAMEGPWGKPGPGGTIWRNPRNIGLNFSKSMGWTDNEILTKMNGANGHKSSLTLPKVKGDDDFREDTPNKENVRPHNVDKLPNIKYGSSPQRKSPDQRRFSLDVKVKHEISYGGNPEDRRSPKKTRFVKRLSNGDKVTKLIIDDSYDSGDAMAVEKKPTPEAAILRVTGGVELVPLLARRRRVGARTLPSSDVTRPADQSCQWRESLNMDYLRELKQQMKVKCIQKEEHRRDSAESVRKHHETWESLWGRQGHGAPLRGKYARNNLAQLLYVAPLTNAQ
ncbi:uncharacterized protein LOC118268672 isoform X1 [Spodoptera frugiperda]|uniref:Uncharacterized protein LOC118268672 isoform X1 n=1 Tax=Spodoptera frugiperda TaxID=7108 RepID=A0A9R0EJT8_SPOFR|nr:uncharacterized protein LOC118268672 isoform X1 [Spodoptera frugiperda]